MVCPRAGQGADGAGLDAQGVPDLGSAVSPGGMSAHIEFYVFQPSQCRSDPLHLEYSRSQSISSTRGTALLRSYLLAVQTHHSDPKSYPALLPSILSACAYRVAAAPSSKPSTPRTPGGGPWPTPPISPEGSQSSGDEADADPDATANAKANVNAVGGPNAPGRVPRFRGFRLVERRFGEIGKGVETREVFERVVRSRKGKERAVGEIWLDGQTVSDSGSALPGMTLWSVE